MAIAYYFPFSLSNKCANVKYYLPIIVLLLSCGRPAQPTTQSVIPTDPTAEKMLLYQRNNGGWPQYDGDPTDYERALDDTFRSRLLADKDRLDATIDDRSTTHEINYLLDTYGTTQNPAYLAAAERGIAYLLRAQNPAGGWPQFFPDSSRYRTHITYNDNAMIDVLWIMKGLADQAERYQPVASPLQRQAKTALDRGIACILNTQVRQNGQLTVWCAQHHSQTLAPAPARAFEPASLSGMESVGIVDFLLHIEQPSPAIRQSIRAAVDWFERVKIDGYNVVVREDDSQPSGRDRVLVSAPGSTVWARFYELGTNRPIFTGRDGIIRYRLPEIENERRVGYAFYGHWPQDLLQKAYPAWHNRWEK